MTGKFIIDIEFLDLKTASPDVRYYQSYSVSFIHQSFILLTIITYYNGLVLPISMVLCFGISIIVTNIGNEKLTCPEGEKPDFRPLFSVLKNMACEIHRTKSLAQFGVKDPRRDDLTTQLLHYLVGCCLKAFILIL